MTNNQIKDIVESDLVTIGNHTWSHPDLSSIDNLNRKRNEIEQSKNVLENKFDTPIKYFSYPYGEYDQESVRLVQESHELGVTTAQELVNSETIQPLVPRISGHKDQAVLEFELTELGQGIKHLYQSIPSIQDL